MALLIYNLLLIIVLEYLVLLFFFKKEWLPCLQFSALANAITFAAGLLFYGKLGFDFWPIMFITVVIEAFGVYFFWIVKPVKALTVSLAANIVSTGFFPLMDWLGINVFPF
ncbi:hypothetical protein BH09BAC1_BH09BAC1_12660 [soil metagenome]